MMKSPKAWITVPAESVPLCPSTKITRVEATLSASRNSVANNKTVGNDEKSRGLSALIQIIAITNDSVILKVKNKSSKKGGRGTTIIIMMQNNTLGITSEDELGTENDCQKFDSAALLIISVYIILTGYLLHTIA
jgi:hypothetical protein